MEGTWVVGGEYGDVVFLAKSWRSQTLLIDGRPNNARSERFNYSSQFF
jgi:hypothetical protein